MGINKAFLLNNIASDVQSYGDFATDAGGFLERCLFDAMIDVEGAKNGHVWDFRIAQSTITTTEGALTGYAVPSDFESLAPEEKSNKFWAYDAYSVPPPIADGTFGRRYPISYNRVAGTIEFYEDPGSGSRTFTYLTRATEVDDIEDWPDKPWLKKLLRLRASFYAINKEDDLRDSAKSFWDLSEEMMIREIKQQRKGLTKQDTRTTLDINGNPYYYSFQ